MEFQELIEAQQLRKELELELKKKKEEFEQATSILKAQFDDASDAEDRLKQEAIELLDEQNVDNVVVGDKQILRQERVTVKVDSPIDLKTFILENVNSFKETGVDMDELVDNGFEDTIIIKDKKAVDEAVNNYVAVEGRLPSGVTEQKTKYITIKQYGN
jgi:hypothetical protein|tara:strand:- start:775 stop:1251 length:477 start_codon:yes stop_codon:yes gene_type:complete